MMDTLNYNLKMLRQRKNWTQAVVSKLLNLSVPAYSKIESGSTDLNLARIKQIAGIYNISVADLLSNDQKSADNVFKKEIFKYKTLYEESNSRVVDLQVLLIGLYEELYLIKKLNVIPNDKQEV